MPFRGGNWDNGSNAGVFAVNLNDPRSNSNHNVGFRLWATHIKIRKSTSLRIKRNLKGVMKRYNEGDCTLEHATRVVDSYFGLLKHCNSYALKTEIFGDYEKGIDGWFVLTRNQGND